MIYYMYNVIAGECNFFPDTSTCLENFFFQPKKENHLYKTPRGSMGLEYTYIYIFTYFYPKNLPFM